MPIRAAAIPLDEPMKKLLHHGLLAILLNGLFAIVGPIVESAWYVMRLSAMPVPQHYFFPVEGVRAAALRDSWQAPRDGGRRTHEGIDIFAPRGTPIRTTTEGVVREPSAFAITVGLPPSSTATLAS